MLFLLFAGMSASCIQKLQEDSMRILKFGGSSVGSPERIRRLLGILQDYREGGVSFAVVCSAFGGVTDQLIEMSHLAKANDKAYLKYYKDFCKRHQDAAQELLEGEELQKVQQALAENHKTLENLLLGISLVKETSTRTLDYLLSFGERNSNYIIAAAFRQMGYEAQYVDARKLIRTNSLFGRAVVHFPKTKALLQEHFAKARGTQIVTGFIASDEEGATTTLGRGGSDYTASLLAAALGAERLEIWTDVAGVLTADPRKVKSAFPIPRLSYAEAMEMSHFGAKVIYPPTIQPAMSAGIPIYIKSTFAPEKQGTLIQREADRSDEPVKGISSLDRISLLTLSGSGLIGVPGSAARLFDALARADVNIILITQGSSEHAITFAVLPEQAEQAQAAIEAAFELEMQAGIVKSVKREDDMAIVAIIGENMRYRPGIAAHLFTALGQNGINAVAIAQGSSELNISVVIPAKDERKALNALHEHFFLSEVEVRHLFIVGVGLVGSTLLEQIRQQSDSLRKHKKLEIKVIGLANSRKMLFDPDGIELDSWKERIETSGERMDMQAYVQQMKALNLRNALFVDNTATEEVPRWYAEILDSSISISTPNKVAASGPYKRYRELKQLAQKRNVAWMFETNVGAGLPVIDTLNDLVNSGDRIIRIEGVLSGSMSFIFHAFQHGMEFSEAVLEARRLGYTEPDPRDDLSGKDMQRKILILAREAGYELELEDVQVESILPGELWALKSVEEFLERLPEADASFAALRQKAKDAGKALRPVASFTAGEKRAEIALREVDSSHPFYALNAGDNMIAFTSMRYKERPLVVYGPGAGAEVTAAGIFAEIINLRT